MTREIFIGIDLGTTVLKCAAFERHSGRLLASAAFRLPLRVMAMAGVSSRRRTFAVGSRSH
ncbi:MAG: hypothetical protein ACUVWX_04880 [Kiritimatiellia bacterium]